jgi:hypothetical protein
MSKAGQWQPIDTAPKDTDVRFLGCRAHRNYWPYVYSFAWEDDGKAVWSVADEYFHDDVTHWMPLPEQPK